MSVKEPFSLIRVPSERKRIFKSVVETQAEILIKGAHGAIHRLLPVKIKDDKWLSCQVREAKPTDDFESLLKDEHPANFTLETERYFFLSPLRIERPYIQLRTDTDLYHLQRRKTARVQIPDLIEAVCTITKHNEQSCFLSTKILDFSTGGLRVQYDSNEPEIKSGDQLAISVRLGQRKPFELSSTVRHSVKAQTGQFEQTFGMEFGAKEKTLENKLLWLQLDLQSEIFRKWKRNQL